MKRIIEKLIKENKTISTMESCTGGGIVNAITNIPYASKIIKFSAITYSNEFKIRMDVDEKIINTYSVYSMEVACDMAKKICMFTKSNYGVGVTGKLKRIDEDNLFGEDDLVYLSIYDKDNDKYYNQKIKLNYETREENKEQIIDAFVNLFLSI